MTAFLQKENKSYSVFCEHVKRNISDTIDVLHGLRAEDSVTAHTFECLQSNRTPENWLAVCYPSFKTLSIFIENLADRIKYVQRIVKTFNKTKTKKGTEETRTFKISYFYD